MQLVTNASSQAHEAVDMQLRPHKYCSLRLCRIVQHAKLE